MDEDFDKISGDLDAFFQAVPPDDPEGQGGQETAFFGKTSEKVDMYGRWQDIKARKQYAEQIYTLVAIWLSFMAVIVFRQDHLSDAVLVALLTTTTAKVVFIFYFVARYLFPSPPPKKS